MSRVTATHELTAIVVNWRTPELATRAARSIIADGLPAERVVVVDNGSPDGSAEQVRQGLPECRLIALDEPVGFGRANNLAAAAMPAAFAYLLVNSDAFVHAPGSIAALAEVLVDPAIGAAVPRLLHPDLTLQPSVYPLPRLAPELIRAIGLSRLVPDRWAPRLGAHWAHDHSREIQYAIGAVVLVRAAAWHQLGGLDPRRLLYAEDLDLFWRLNRLGWTSRFVAEAEFVHVGGASTVRRWSEAERAERVAAAEAAMIAEHTSRPMAQATVAVMAAGAARRAAVHRLHGRREAAAVQAGWLRGYLGAFSSNRAARGSSA